MLKLISKNKNLIIFIVIAILGVLIIALFSKQIGALIVFIGSYFGIFNDSKKGKEDEKAKELKDTIDELDKEIQVSKDRQKESITTITDTSNNITDLKDKLKDIESGSDYTEDEILDYFNKRNRK